VAEDRERRVRAVLVAYACHCTTCGGGLMQICGDWAGYAQVAIERKVPGALAMVAIGCAGDADPEPRLGDDQGLALARHHGEAVAAETVRLLALPRRPLRSTLTTQTVTTTLPFAAPFSHEQWRERAREAGIVGRHARHWLAQHAAALPPPPSLPYAVTAWHFGEELALVFLPGEVVVDYSLRLRREFDPSRLWINAYAMWVPGYIPSRRILLEGGYEAETSQWYYNNPGCFAPEVEDLIVRAVHTAVPPAFQAQNAPSTASGTSDMKTEASVSGQVPEALPPR
jgi:neutral ceramidase